MSVDRLPVSSSENYSDDDSDNGAVLLALQLGQVPAGDEDNSTWLPINSLLSSDSPRIEGLDAAHAERLAEVEGELPPILVQRSTMRVIDGMHRLGAARIRGHEKILVQFVDCDEFDAFLVAVAAGGPAPRRRAIHRPAPGGVGPLDRRTIWTGRQDSRRHPPQLSRPASSYDPQAWPGRPCPAA